MDFHWHVKIGTSPISIDANSDIKKDEDNHVKKEMIKDIDKDITQKDATKSSEGKLLLCFCIIMNFPLDIVYIASLVMILLVKIIKWYATLF